MLLLSSTQQAHPAALATKNLLLQQDPLNLSEIHACVHLANANNFSLENNQLPPPSEEAVPAVPLVRRPLRIRLLLPLRRTP